MRRGVVAYAGPDQRDVQNTSTNALVSRLVARADFDLKSDFEALLSGGTVTRAIDEHISFIDLDRSENAVWSLLVASGCLRMSALADRAPVACGIRTYALSITNAETLLAFEGMVRRWFEPARVRYNAFVDALPRGDLEAMNAYMNEVALETFSTFDTGARPSGMQPERYSYGFAFEGKTVIIGGE